MLFGHLLKRLIRHGTLTVIDARGRRHVFEGPREGCPHPDLLPGPVTIRLHDATTQHRLGVNARLALGEAYMDGGLTVEHGTLRDFLFLVCINLEVAERLGNGAPWLLRLRDGLNYLWRRMKQYNPVPRARANVAHHYDLSGDLYDLFLDSDRQYSCAYFPTGATDLEAAQEAKKRHIAAKLRIEPGMEVLDIGSGWGGLALHLARECKARVTGITLSQEQLTTARKRAQSAGLEDRVRFELRDYREQKGSFDRIVSVGMFEHVGVTHFNAYFSQVRSLLREDGIALLHTIGRLDGPGTTNPWLQKYIFPGGYTPALSEIARAVERTHLVTTDVEVLRQHYALTLRHWHDRFQANRDKAARLYDERFCRMWEFYLTGCEAAFRFNGQVVFQVQLARRVDSLPLTRDYITDFERAPVERVPVSVESPAAAETKDTPKRGNGAGKPGRTRRKRAPDGAASSGLGGDRGDLSP